MEPTAQPSVFGRITGRRLRDRGATLVEYALVFALVAVVSLGAVEFLTNQSEAEINNQAECVSRRPPPPECLLTAITTTTTIVPPSITVTTVPVPEPEAPQLTILGLVRSTPNPGPPRWLEADVELTIEQPPDSGGGFAPVPGAIVRATVLLADPADPAVYLPDPWFVNCTTNSVGRCTLRFDVPYDDVTQIRFEVTGADTLPPTVLNGPMVVTRTWS